MSNYPQIIHKQLMGSKSPIFQGKKPITASKRIHSLSQGHKQRIEILFELKSAGILASKAEKVYLNRNSLRKLGEEAFFWYNLWPGNSDISINYLLKGTYGEKNISTFQTEAKNQAWVHGSQ